MGLGKHLAGVRLGRQVQSQDDRLSFPGMGRGQRRCWLGLVQQAETVRTTDSASGPLGTSRLKPPGACLQTPPKAGL